MTLEFAGTLYQWRGPAPHYFVAVPAPLCLDLAASARLVSYGWGMIPVHARIGGTRWPTSLFPKDGGYLVPVRVNVRRSEDLAEGQTVTVQLEIRG